MSELQRRELERTTVAADFYQPAVQPADSIKTMLSSMGIEQYDQQTEQSVARHRERDLQEGQSSEPLRPLAEIIANARDYIRERDASQRPEVSVHMVQKKHGGWNLIVAEGGKGLGMHAETFVNKYLPPFASGSAGNDQSVGMMGVGAQQQFGWLRREGDTGFVLSAQSGNVMIAKTQPIPDQPGEVAIAMAGKQHSNEDLSGTQVILQLSGETAREVGLSPEAVLAYLKDRYGGASDFDLNLTVLAEKSIAESLQRETFPGLDHYANSTTREALAIQARRAGERGPTQSREQTFGNAENPHHRVREVFTLTGREDDYQTIRSSEQQIALRYSHERTDSHDNACLINFQVFGVSFGEPIVLRGNNLPKELFLNIEQKLPNITEARSNIRLNQENIQAFTAILGEIERNSDIEPSDKVRILVALEEVYQRFGAKEMLPPKLRNRKEHNIIKQHREAIEQTVRKLQNEEVTVVPTELAECVAVPEDAIEVPWHLTERAIFDQLPELPGLTALEGVSGMGNTRVYLADSIVNGELFAHVGDFLLVNKEYLPELASNDASLRQAGLVKLKAAVENRKFSDREFDRRTTVSIEYSSVQVSPTETAQIEASEASLENSASFPELEACRDQWEAWTLEQKRWGISELLRKMGERQSLGNSLKSEIQSDRFPQNKDYFGYRETPSRLQKAYYELSEGDLDLYRQLLLTRLEIDPATDWFPPHLFSDVPLSDCLRIVENAPQDKKKFISDQVMQMLAHFFVSNEIRQHWVNNPEHVVPIYGHFFIDEHQNFFKAIGKSDEWIAAADTFVMNTKRKDAAYKTRGYVLAYSDQLEVEDFEELTTRILEENDENSFDYAQIFYEATRARIPPHKLLQACDLCDILALPYDILNKHTLFFEGAYYLSDQEKLLQRFLLSDVELSIEKHPGILVTKDDVIDPARLLVLAHAGKLQERLGSKEHLAQTEIDESILHDAKRELLQSINRLNPKPGSSFRELVKNSLSAIVRSEEEGNNSSDIVLIQDHQEIINGKQYYAATITDFVGMDPAEAPLKLTIPSEGEGIHGVGFLRLLADADCVVVRTSKGEKAVDIVYTPKRENDMVVDITMQSREFDPEETGMQPFQGTTVTVLKETEMPEVEAMLFREQVTQFAKGIPKGRVYLNPKDVPHCTSPSEVWQSVSNGTLDQQLKGEAPLNSEGLALFHAPLGKFGTLEVRSLREENTSTGLTLENTAIDGFDARAAIEQAPIPPWAKRTLLTTGVTFDLSHSSVRTTRDGSGIPNQGEVLQALTGFVEEHYQAMLQQLAFSGRLDPSVIEQEFGYFFSNPSETRRGKADGETLNQRPLEDMQRGAYHLGYELPFPIQGENGIEYCTLDQIVVDAHERRLALEALPSKIRAKLEGAMRRKPETSTSEQPPATIRNKFLERNVPEPPKYFEPFPDGQRAIMEQLLVLCTANSELADARFAVKGVEIDLDESPIPSNERVLKVYCSTGKPDVVAFYIPGSDTLHFTQEEFRPLITDHHNPNKMAMAIEAIRHELEHALRREEERAIAHTPDFYNAVERGILAISAQELARVLAA